MSKVLRIPHCSHWGAYTVLVEDGKVVGVEPAPQDTRPSPIIHSVKEWMNPDRRILKPMIRSGWLAAREKSDRTQRGSDRFVEVSWDEAEALIATEIERVRSQFGNQSIFAGSYGWASCGRFHHPQTLLKRWLNLLGGFTGHVDTYSYAAGPVILKHVLGSDEALVGLASTLDTVVEHTETLLVFGSMSPRTAQLEAGGLLRRTLETNLRGLAAGKGRVILVSPLGDDIPEWVNAEWWPIRPNTDAALMLALACEIVLAGRHDREFLARHCSGADTFLDYLSGRSDGVVKNAAWASRITGLEAEKITQLAATISTTRTMLTVSWSLQRAQHGEQPYWAAVSLAAVLGQIGLPGGGVGFGYGSTAGVGGPFGIGKTPSMTAGAKAIDSDIPVARIADLLTSPGARYDYNGQAKQYPDIKLVYWAGGNPFHHHQDLNRLERAWTCPETIIVQDPMMTATARRADIILPACTTLERNDLAATRRSEFIVAMHQAVSALGSSRSDFDIFNNLADRLGVAELFNEGRTEMQWVRHLYDTARLANSKELEFEMPSFDAFWEKGFTELPVRSKYTYLADYRDDPVNKPLRTESGRIVLTSERLAALNYDDCGKHATWYEPAEWLGAAEPGMLHLISCQPEGRLHSQLDSGEASLKQKRSGREFATLNPSDATGHGIADGDTIRLFNERGACLATARIRPSVRQGVVVLPTGAWLTMRASDRTDLSGNPNVLTLDIPSSQFSQGCAAYTCLVRVERYRDSAPNAIATYLEEITEIRSGPANDAEND